MAAKRPIMSKWIFLAAALTSLGASAAELPSQHKEVAPPAAKRCSIGGQVGYLSADGQVCLRISGFVGAGVAAGSRPKP